MKAMVLADAGGRMRIRVANRLTLEQAEAVEQVLFAVAGVRCVTALERSGDVVIVYEPAARDNVRAAIARHSLKLEAPVSDARVIRRQYEDKVFWKTTGKVLRDVVLPAPVTMAWHVLMTGRFILRAAGTFVSGEPKVALLDSVSVTTAMLRGQTGSAGTMMFLLDMGRILDSYSRDAALSELRRRMRSQPAHVYVYAGAGYEERPIDDVHSGDLILVRKGQVIPLDGLVTEGGGYVNQSPLTGEETPKHKTPGSYAYAGTLLVQGELTIKVDNTHGEGRYDHIMNQVYSALENKATHESRARELSDKFVPVSLAAAGLTWLLTGDETRTGAVLNVDYSCALNLASPLAYMAAAKELSATDITVKGAVYLEHLARADTIVFDKSGTLTQDAYVFKDVIAFGDDDPDELLRVAACLEEHFPHRMADAIVDAAAEKGLTHDEMHADVTFVASHGIMSSINDVPVVIGSSHFVFDDVGATCDEAGYDKIHTLPEDYSRLYLAVDKKVRGVILVDHPMKPDVPRVVEQLRTRGLENIIMVTGDSAHAARAFGRKAGIDDVRAHMFPEDKAALIRELREDGHTVIAVGDGLSDALALSEADVGMALGQGAAVAREMADVISGREDLGQLLVLRDAASRLEDKVRLNGRTIMVWNTLLILAGLTGLINDTQAALLHNGSTILISLQAMGNITLD